MMHRPLMGSRQGMHTRIVGKLILFGLMSALSSIGLRCSRSEVDHRRIALEFCQGLIAGKASVVASYGAVGTRQALDAEGLAELRERLIANHGLLRQWGEAEVVADGFLSQKVRLKGEFEREDVEFEVTFNRGGQVADLRFRSLPATRATGRGVISTEDDALQADIRERTHTIEKTYELTLWIAGPSEEAPATGARVVLLPDAGAQDKDERSGAHAPFRDIARGLARRGIETIRFDKATWRHSERLSQEPAIDLDLEIVDDARLAFDHALEDRDEAWLLAHGDGLLAAARLLLAREEAGKAPACAGTILMAPTLEPLYDRLAARRRRSETDLRKVQKINRTQERIAKSEAGRAPDGLGLPASYWNSYLELLPEASLHEIGRLCASVLVLLPENAPLWRADDTRVLRERLPDAEVLSFEGLGHMMSVSSGRADEARGIEANVLESIRGFIPEDA